MSYQSEHCLKKREEIERLGNIENRRTLLVDLPAEMLDLIDAQELN